MWGAPRSGRCHPERSHWGKTWPRRKCVGLRQSVASARWHFCHVGPSTPIAAVRANCQYWLVSLPRQHRASHLLRVIVFPVLVAISLSPITGATVSEASAGEKPVTPLVISRVRSSGEQAGSGARHDLPSFVVVNRMLGGEHFLIVARRIRPFKFFHQNMKFRSVRQTALGALGLA